MGALREQDRTERYYLRLLETCEYNWISFQAHREGLRACQFSEVSLTGL